MKEILEKYNDCDTFSLTGMVDGYKVSEKEFSDALAYKKKRNRQYLEEKYNEYELQQKGYPEFDKLYSEIEQECKEFDNEENRQKYIKHMKIIKNGALAMNKLKIWIFLMIFSVLSYQV